MKIPQETTKITFKVKEGLPEEKEQLDKNDPDNYGACYAIAGFNDCLAKVKQVLEVGIHEE